MNFLKVRLTALMFLHVVPDPGVEGGEVLLGDDVVVVEVEHVVEEVSELVPLEAREQRPALQHLRLVVLRPLDEGAPCVLHPPRPSLSKQLELV